MTTFSPHRKGQVYVELPRYAAELLANLTRQLLELLRDGEAPVHAEDPLEALLTVEGPREPPEDPALRRLFPSAHRHDEEAAAEFRRFTEPNLRQSKVDDGTLVLAALEGAEESDDGDIEFVLDRDAARSWMRWLTALRLTLAERLGITAGDEEYWDALAPDDERFPLYEIYSWLGWLLESLVAAVQR